MNNKVEKLLNKISKIVAAQNERNKERYANGDLFNVFNILGLESNEVRLHSSLLAEFLRSNGMCGVGSTFQKVVLQDFVWVVGNLRKKHYLCSRYENNRRNT